MAEEEEKKEESANVKVMVRVRLFNKREIAMSEKKHERLQSCVKMRGKTCAIVEYTHDEKGFEHEKERDAFEFDECFWSLPFEQAVSDMEYADQLYVYERSGLIALQAAIDGFNCCIFAYGQTGSGKTYSMLGAANDPGISPRLVDDLFHKVEEIGLYQPTTKCIIECTFFEIYNEKVRDLFNKKSKVGEYDSVKIRQHPTKGVFVEGLTRKEVQTSDQTKVLIEKGTKERAMAETKMNATSSRSHAVFQIQVTQNDALKGTQKVSTINLVDLAGSEKISMSGATGQTLTEAKLINLSLSTLRRVIDTLIENSQASPKHQKVPPFRESVLTYTLSESLGGNSKTQMISTISPHVSNLEDTLGTLRYALRAKAIVCTARVNEEKSAAMMDAMKDEIMQLRQKLRTGGTGGGGGGEVPQDIQREIQIREAEVKRMEDTQEKMTKLLAESKAKEEEMKEKMEELNQQQAELNIAVSVQKRERFASAFRNAFLISQDKERIAVSQQELEHALQERNDLLEKNRELEISLAGQEQMARHEESEKEKVLEQLATLRKKMEEKLGEKDNQIKEVQSSNEGLRRSLNETTQKLRNTETHHKEAEDKIASMQEELLLLTFAMDREATEREKLRMNMEESAMEYTNTIETLRKRKDKYKLHNAEAHARAKVLEETINSNVGDRTQMQETIRLQQQLLQEKEFLVEASTKLVEEARQRAREYEQVAYRTKREVEILTESLREYQTAAAKWMTDHSTMEKELARLKSLNTVPKVGISIHQDPSTPQPFSASRSRSPMMAPQASSQRRGQSPASARANSPYFRSPNIKVHANSGGR